jgi:methylated-DNA-[protein]-cysteine S-methyltransferase
MNLDERFLERFASAAMSEGLVDAAFAELDTPIGRLTVVRTETGVCRVAFAEEEPDEVLAQVAGVVGPRVISAPAELRPIADAIEAYLEGETSSLDLPVDMSLVRSDFHRKVLEALRTFHRGEVATYSALAARIGRPRAVRATGTACARNPVPIVVPCHRVLPASGGVGNYGGGAERKRWLLSLEGAPLTVRS